MTSAIIRGDLLRDIVNLLTAPGCDMTSCQMFPVYKLLHRCELAFLLIAHAVLSMGKSIASFPLYFNRMRANNEHVISWQRNHLTPTRAAISKPTNQAFFSSAVDSMCLNEPE